MRQTFVKMIIAAQTCQVDMCLIFRNIYKIINKPLLSHS